MDAPSYKQITKTTCPYCGVGCGVLAKKDYNNNITIEGDPDHPANFGKLCSKGSTLADTLGPFDRIYFPQINGEKTSWDAALSAISEKFKRVIEEHGPDAVAFYVSGQLLTEDYYVANKLMKGYIGSGNIDTNSRLCMASSVVGHKKAFGTDTVPGNYEDLEEADLVVLVGSNMAWCHPILFQRILKSKEKNPNKKIIVLDPRKTATSDFADMHVPLMPGSDVPLFMGLFNYLKANGKVDRDFVADHTDGCVDVEAASRDYTLSKVAELSGLSIEDIQAFYDAFLKTDKVVTVYSQGVNQATDGTDKVSAIINCHLLTGRIGKVGAGPFSITGQPNAMGGREVGGLANQLASHLDIGNPNHRQFVQDFWQSPTMAPKAGLTAVDMFDAVDSGDIKAIWIMATNPVVSMPNADKVKRALEKCDLVVVSDIYHSSDTVKCADIVLPSTGWGEKDGMVTNSERRMSRQRPFTKAPGEARHDWWQLCELGKRLGFDGFNFENPAQIFREYAALSTFVNKGRRDLDLEGVTQISDQEFDDLTPVYWPVIPKFPEGRARLFDDNIYFTANQKAQFIVPNTHEPIASTDQKHLILNTGRIRDQWHTMTRTGRSSKLATHIGEPFVEIHPDDAKECGIKTAEIVRVFSEHGEVLARANVTDRQNSGSVFMPMHFTSALSAQGRVDAVAHAKIDRYSDQPALKSTPVQIEKLSVSWYGFMAIETDNLDQVPDKKDATYWAKSVTQSGLRFELAGLTPLKSEQDFLSQFITQIGHLNFVEFSGVREAQTKIAAYDGDKLKGILFASNRPVFAKREWICTQIGQSVEKGLKLNVLAGIPSRNMPDRGRVICTCMDVSDNEVKACIKQGHDTVASIGNITGAGTNCGSCQSDLKKILEAMHVPEIA